MGSCGIGACVGLLVGLFGSFVCVATGAGGAVVVVVRCRCVMHERHPR
jgi:hypothetical protein